MISVGIDEVGRGSWAGPLVSAAVILNKNISGLTDSKRLTKQQRELLAPVIMEMAVSYGIGWVESWELDIIGLTQAVSVSMNRAMDGIKSLYDEIIIDGNYNFLPTFTHVRTIVHADMLVPAVSAASIIAKVARDERMKYLSIEYPEYGFEQNVGYGTAFHRAMIMQFGLCKIHRRSFKPMKTVINLNPASL